MNNSEQDNALHEIEVTVGKGHGLNPAYSKLLLADNARLRAENERLPKLDRIFLAAQNWYGTVRGHLKYDSCGNCVDFGGMKPEAAELVKALDVYHVWRSLSPAAPVTQAKKLKFFCNHGKIDCPTCQPEAHAE